ncbi:hypothetical protein ABZP36_032788 [Zizania latifolia]
METEIQIYRTRGYELQPTSPQGLRDARDGREETAREGELTSDLDRRRADLGEVKKHGRARGAHLLLLPPRDREEEVGREPNKGQ